MSPLSYKWCFAFSRLKEIIFSIAAAFLGVQSRKNADKDFNSESPTPYVIVGIIATLLFIAVLIAVVRFSLSHFT